MRALISHNMKSGAGAYSAYLGGSVMLSAAQFLSIFWFCHPQHVALYLQA